MTKADQAKLSEDAAWLRRVALALVRDVSLAEDVVQEVWLTAIRAQPRFEGSARPWLAKVARNLVRSGVRSARSHERWRRLSVDVDERPSPEALINRQEELQILGRLVAELDEPYRSTIVLCYGEGLTPSQVARRLDLAPGTVRWRLKYALDRLRAEFYGPGAKQRRACALALLGVQRATAPRAPARPLRAQLGLRLGAVTAGATLLGLTAVFVVRPAALPSPQAAASIASGREGATAIAARSGLRPRPPLALRAGSGIPPWVAQPGVAARRVAGRVLDGAAPAAGARVVLGHQLARYGALAPLETASDGGGHFDFGPQLAAPYTVMAQMPGRAMAAVRIDLRQPNARLAPEALQLAVLPCDDGLRGRVLDPEGLPIVGARVLASGLLGVTTGADGWYLLCVQPGQLDTRVEASGYGTILIKANVAGLGRRDVVLVPQASLAGQVIHQDGEPVESAHVRAWRADPGPRERFVGPLSALTDAEGRFQLDGLEPGRWLFAADAAAAAAGPPVERTLLGGWSEQPVMIPVRPPQQIAGRVLEGGRPVVGASVSLMSTAGGAFSDSARTQDDGDFVIDRVQPGQLRVIVRGYRVLEPSVIDQPSAAAKGLAISVQRAAPARPRANDVPTPGGRSRSVPE